MFDCHNIFFRGHSKLAPNNGRAQSNALLGILMRSWAANEVNQYEIPNATTSSIFRQRSLWCHRGRCFVSRYQEAGWMEREREREGCACVCRDPRLAWTTIHPCHLRGRGVSADSKAVFRETGGWKFNRRIPAMTFHSKCRSSLLKWRINANEANNAHCIRGTRESWRRFRGCKLMFDY